MKKLFDVFRKKPNSPTPVKEESEQETFPALLPKYYRGPEAVHFLGEARLMQFLNYLRVEHGLGTFIAGFFEELEGGSSLEELFAIKEEKTAETYDERDFMKTAYTLDVQETQEDKCFNIWWGHYADIPLGRTLGYSSTEYFVTFDEADNVQKVKSGGFMMT